jgi:hypothetical protein
MYASSGRSLTAWQSNASGYKISNKYISHDFVFRSKHKQNYRESSNCDTWYTSDETKVTTE